MLRVSRPVHRGLTFLIALAMASLGIPSAAQADDSGPALFYSESFDLAAPGWSLGPGWGFNDTTAYEGRSLWYDMESCELNCRSTATSPWFSIPEGSDAFAYLWLISDLSDFWGDGLQVWIETRDDDVVSITPGPNMMAVGGWHTKIDLRAASGMEARLHFEVDQSWQIPFYDGVLIDELVITDLDLHVENVALAAAGAGTSETIFTLGDAGAEGIVRTATRSSYGPADGSNTRATVVVRLLLDGEVVFYGPAGGAAPDLRTATVNLLGEDVVRIEPEATGGGSMGLRILLDLGRLPAGTYRWSVGIIGDGEHQVTTMIRQFAGAPFDVSFGHSAAATPAVGEDFDIRGAHVTSGGSTKLMVDSVLEVETSGPSFGIVFTGAALEHSRLYAPNGTLDEHNIIVSSDVPGTWRMEIDVLVESWPFHWVAIFEQATAFDPATMAALDNAGDLPVAETGQPDDATPPAPTYMVTQEYVGFVSCGAAALAVQTNDRCEDLDPNSRTAFTHDLADGATAIRARLVKDGGSLTDAELCVRATNARFAAPGTACTTEGWVTLGAAAPGELLGLPAGFPLEFEVRAGPNQGVAYQQGFELEIEIDHWGGA